MSLITEFTIPAEAFALDHTFSVAPDVRIEIERLATHSREWVMPILWATYDDLDEIERAMKADQSINELEAMDTTGNVGEFTVEWAEDVQTLVDRIVDQHGIMQEAEAADRTWYLKLKFLDQDALNGFQEYFHDQGYDFELQRIYHGRGPKEREYDLTPEQREVLVVALENGYFSVPRDAQIQDLADELEISTNAVSQRLRRATGNLTKNTLMISPPGGITETD